MVCQETIQAGEVQKGHKPHSSSPCEPRLWGKETLRFASDLNDLKMDDVG